MIGLESLRVYFKVTEYNKEIRIRFSSTIALGSMLMIDGSDESE